MDNILLILLCRRSFLPQLSLSAYYLSEIIVSCVGRVFQFYSDLPVSPADVPFIPRLSLSIDLFLWNPLCPPSSFKVVAWPTHNSFPLESLSP